MRRRLPSEVVLLLLRRSGLYYCNFGKCFTLDQGAENSAPQFSRLSDVDQLLGQSIQHGDTVMFAQVCVLRMDVLSH